MKRLPGSRLHRLDVELVPSRSAIYRCLKRHGLIELRRRRKRRDEFRRWERDHPMQLWQMDVMGGVMLEDDTELNVVTGVDDHSRFCVAAGLVGRATSKAVCAVLASSLSRYGIPDEILTENGKVFTGRFGPQPVEVLYWGISEPDYLAWENIWMNVDTDSPLSAGYNCIFISATSNYVTLSSPTCNGYP